MSNAHASNDEFFLQLSQLFEERRKSDHGSVFLTQKCLSFGEIPDSDSVPVAGDQFKDHSLPKRLPIIIRATNGKSKDNKLHKIKLSTIVEPDALEGFFIRYAEICKLGMSGLKKRDRSRGKKKTKAKKKRVGALGGLEEPKKT